jgi:ribosomal protein L7Ae-like RNA K-turn-binding protein
MTNKICGTLGLCRRAGKLAMGYDSVAESLQKRKSALVILASDASAKTEKNIRFLAEQSNVAVKKLELTAMELGSAIGKSCVCLSVEDKGFGKLLSAEQT